MIYPCFLLPDSGCLPDGIISGAIGSEGANYFGTSHAGFGAWVSMCEAGLAHESQARGVPACLFCTLCEQKHVSGGGKNVGEKDVNCIEQ